MLPQISPQGLATAYQRAKQHARTDVSTKAVRVAKTIGLEWVKHLRASD
jgi:hypothetical protein